MYNEMFIIHLRYLTQKLKLKLKNVCNFFNEHFYKNTILFLYYYCKSIDTIRPYVVFIICLCYG